jgi:RimJ/RimL family protein N-acetyltransferase
VWRSRVTGHGVAVTAARLCAQFGFEEPHLKRLEIFTYLKESPGNEFPG